MNRKVFYIAIIFVVLAGCTQKWVKGRPAAYDLAKGTSVSFDGMIVTVTDIKESRCPMNAKCIRAGEATALFTLHHKQQTQVFALCTGADCKQSQGASKTTISFDGTQYEFDLKDITPNPTRTLIKQEQRVAFSVKKTG